METITSRTNPLCTHIRKLASSRSYRERQGQFLCDSPKLLEEALAHGGEVRTVIFTERAAPRRAFHPRSGRSRCRRM